MFAIINVRTAEDVGSRKNILAKVHLIRQPKAATFSNTLRSASLEKA